MAMVVKNNMSAVNTLNTLNKNQSALSQSLQKVSSGMKINSAGDDGRCPKLDAGEALL